MTQLVLVNRGGDTNSTYYASGVVTLSAAGAHGSSNQVVLQAVPVEVASNELVCAVSTSGSWAAQASPHWPPPPPLPGAGSPLSILIDTTHVVFKPTVIDLTNPTGVVFVLPWPGGVMPTKVDLPIFQALTSALTGFTFASASFHLFNITSANEPTLTHTTIAIPVTPV